MIRVIHVGPSVRSRGGIAAVIASLLDRLGREPQMSVEAIPTTMWRESGVLRNGLLFVFALLRVLLACAARPKPLLHVHLASRASVLRKGIIIRLARLLRAPCLLHDHGIETFYGKSGEATRSWIRGTFRRASAVVSITEKERQFLASVISSPVEVVPNAVAIPERPEPRSADRRGPVVFLFLARIAKTKGAFDLLEAFASLCSEGVPTRLVLAGNGEVEKARAWLKDRNLDRQVDVPGWVEGEAKSASFKGADVFVLPSYYDNLPVSILEAMAFGLPVIATAVGGIPEAVADGETGLLVQPGDVGALAQAMKRLASDHRLRAAMAEAARARAEERFSLEAVAARLKQIYQAIAAG